MKDGRFGYYFYKWSVERKLSALEEAKKLEDRSEEIHIPTVVLFELWEGIERSIHKVEEEVLAVLRSFLELPLNQKMQRKQIEGLER